MIDAPTMFSTKPVRIIAAATIFPLLKTTALGAVATGNMNAQLALKAAGTINNSGAIEAPIAAAASTGISNVVVAVLLVVSVKKLTPKQSTNSIMKIGQPASTPNNSPNSALSPEVKKARAIQIPPENNNNIPQGI